MTPGIQEGCFHCVHKAVLWRLQTRAVTNWNGVQVSTGPLCMTSKLGADISDSYVLANHTVMPPHLRTLLNSYLLQNSFLPVLISNITQFIVISTPHIKSSDAQHCFAWCNKTFLSVNGENIAGCLILWFVNIFYHICLSDRTIFSWLLVCKLL